MDRSYRDTSFAAPFAVLGAVGGWLTARILIGDSRSDAPISILLLVCTPIVAGVLGEILRTRVARSFVLRTVISTVLAGMVNGILVGTFVGLLIGTLYGALFGFFFALPFVPANLLVTAAARRVGSAAAGSPVDGAHRRAVWVAVAASVAMGALIAVPTRSGPAVHLVSLLAAFAILVLGLYDLFALDDVRRIARVQSRMRPRATVGPQVVDAGALAYDLGVGDGIYDEIAQAATPYREADRLVQVVRGEPHLALQALRWAVFVDLLALTAALGAFVLQLAFVKVI